MRVDYTKDALDERLVDPDPYGQFALWFEQARVAGGVEPNAMTLATANADGVPTARIVLLKGFDRSGMTFFTSYSSAKGLDISENPRASLLFYWPALERQIRLAGSVYQVPREESQAYFEARPRGSQIAAHLGLQSQVVDGRESLLARFEALEAEFGDEPISPPEWWGGYRLTPSMFEFWQGRSNRMHDRVRYRLEPPNGWIIERLGP
ncbi:MAG: pyridoxamine 5'-phosphate oxidase [Thermomicrobiales bacterium]